MPSLARLAAVTLAFVAGACARLDTFACADGSECVHDGVPGTCEPGGLCSFPDAACPSGKKYGEFAGDQSGLCVEGATTPPTTDDPTGSASDSMSAGTTVPDATGSTTPDPTSDPSQVTTTTTDPTTSPAETTTGGPTCAEFGDSCADDLPCCSPCMACDDTATCVAAPPETGPDACGGPCFTCDPNGQCAPNPAAPCMTDCNQLVWQSQVDGASTSCLGYADLPLPSTCGDAGQCLPPPLDMCPDPGLMPGTAKQLARCDTVCLADAAATLCTPGAPATDVTMTNFCQLGETAMCADACVLDMNMLPAQDDAACDAAGACTHTVTSCTGGLVCNPQNSMCLNKCNSDDDCQSGMCMGSKCI